MATITITITDLDQGRVSIVSDPNFDLMAKMDNSGNALTPAHGYAIGMLNAARRISKSKEPTNLIQIPKVKKIIT